MANMGAGIRQSHGLIAALPATKSLIFKAGNGLTRLNEPLNRIDMIDIERTKVEDFHKIILFAK